MEMQLELFDAGVHEHVYEKSQGPHVTDRTISVGEDRWCWTCASWVNKADISQWQAHQMSPEELALCYARKIKAGEVDKREAVYMSMMQFSWDFFRTLEAINIAIGNLNAGEN